MGVPRHAARPTIPYIVHEDDPAFRRINTPVELWQTSATRMVDNFLDITHFPFVHAGTFGRGAGHASAAGSSCEPLDDGWSGYRYEVAANNTDSARWPAGRRRRSSSAR